MNEQRKATDWQGVHARLERARQAVESGGGIPPEEMGRILRNRALALTTSPEDTEHPMEMIQLLVFTLSGERFGIETAHLLEVSALREVIPVPCTPDFVVGVIHYRGRILTILDLRRLLSLPAKEMTEGRRVISVEAGGMTFGIIADGVAGVLAAPADKMAAPPEALSGLRLALTRGITEEFITVLDLDALARTPEIQVNDEVN